MPRIDHHVHLYPDELNRDPAAWAATHAEPHWARLALRRRANGSPVQDFPSVGQLLQALDAAGLERAILLGWYWENADTCRWHNRAMAAWVRAHPDRLSAYATLQPAAPAERIAQELALAREEGLCGLGELSPHSVGARCDSPGMQAALALAEAWSWPVNIHVTDPRSRSYPGKIETPAEDFRTLARTWPRVHFTLAHWAGGYDLRSYPNVWVDTAAAPLIYGDEAWAMRGQSVRADQVLFGSDYPLRLYRDTDAATGLARYTAEARRHQC